MSLEDKKQNRQVKYIIYQKINAVEGNKQERQLKEIKGEKWVKCTFESGHQGKLHCESDILAKTWSKWESEYSRLRKDQVPTTCRVCCHAQEIAGHCDLELGFRGWIVGDK